MDFVVLDFETAHFGRDPCEIGLTFVVNSQIIDTQGWLIKPSCYPHFDPSCVDVHGIEPYDVKHSPKFPVVWRVIRPLLKGKLILAHNAAYDMSVLRRTLDEYGLQYPNLKYGCTYYCSRKAFPHFQNHKLDYLCKVLNISTHEHHRAEADSQAAAELALIMFRDHNINSMEDIQRKFRVNLWQIFSNGHYQKMPMPITIRTKKSPKSKFDHRDLDEQKHITELANKKLGRNTEKITQQKEKQGEYVREVSAGVYRYDTFPTQQIDWQQIREAEEQRKLKEERWQKEREQEEARRKVREWLQQQKEKEQRERERQEAERQRKEEEARRERERKEEEARKRKEEWRQWCQEHENMLVVAVSGIFALLLVLGMMWLNSHAKWVQANRLAEKERLIAKQEEQERQERLATEQREREEAERLAAEQRRLEELERRREAEEQYTKGLTHDADQEYAEAEKWFRLAAERGHAKAQIKLGDIFFRGIGVDKDKDEVIKWYRKAAEQGDATAQFKLGWCYYEGTQIAKNEAEAIQWWRKARSQGHALDSVVINILRKVDNRR